MLPSRPVSQTASSLDVSKLKFCTHFPYLICMQHAQSISSNLCELPLITCQSLMITNPLIIFFFSVILLLPRSSIRPFLLALCSQTFLGYFIKSLHIITIHQFFVVNLTYLNYLSLLHVSILIITLPDNGTKILPNRPSVPGMKQNIVTQGQGTCFTPT